jgi:iron-sulfur cluster assembly protein
MFKLTTAAAEQVLKAAKEGGAEGMSLRLAASSNSDGSIDYRMGFDAATEEDIRFQSEGVDLVMAPEDVPLLDQTVMDFVEIEPGKPHFIFLNPKDPTYEPPGEGEV